MPESRLVRQVLGIQTRNARCGDCELCGDKPVVIRAVCGDQKYLACVKVECSQTPDSSEVKLKFNEPQLVGRANWIALLSGCGLHLVEGEYE